MKYSADNNLIESLAETSETKFEAYLFGNATELKTVSSRKGPTVMGAHQESIDQRYTQVQNLV